MGLFSSSKSKSTTTNETQNAGFSEVQGNALAIQGDGNTVEMLDGGAIEKAFTFAGDALGTVESISDNAKQTTASAIQSVTESARSEMENLVVNAMKYAFYAALVFGGIKLFQGFKK